jgi:hypothetical protein
MINRINGDGPPARNWRPHRLTNAPKSCSQTHGTVPQPRPKFKCPTTKPNFPPPRAPVSMAPATGPQSGPVLSLGCPGPTQDVLHMKNQIYERATPGRSDHEEASGSWRAHLSPALTSQSRSLWLRRKSSRIFGTKRKDVHYVDANNYNRAEYVWIKMSFVM